MKLDLSIQVIINKSIADGAARGISGIAQISKLELNVAKRFLQSAPL